MQLPNAKFCDVFVWEHDLEDYMNRRFTSAVELADYHKQRADANKADLDESVGELVERESECRKLKRQNKLMRFFMAASAPLAATVGVLAAWVAK